MVDDDIRLEAATRLPEVDEAAAADALRAIARDQSVDDGFRSDAAEQLARLLARAATGEAAGSWPPALCRGWPAPDRAGCGLALGF
jgi:hypothetical protein